jgi:hypothetical protein
MLRDAEVDLVSSFRSSSVDCSGGAVFFLPSRGRVELVVFAAMSCTMRILRILRIDGAKCQSMKSVGDVWRKNVFVSPSWDQTSALPLAKRVS